MRARPLVAVLALALVVAAALALWPGRPSGEAGMHEIQVIGLYGVMWNGTVAGATPLDALEAAAGAGGFGIVVTGSGCDAYVRSIGGHEARGAAGWVFEVGTSNADGVVWDHPLASAGCVALGPGQLVRWSWSEGGGY